MSSSPIVLLDTGVVAAIFAVSKKGPHVSREKEIWLESVRTLIETVSPKCLVRVPTPVCYELMAMNQEWYDFISRSKNEVFRFSSYSISNTMLKKAAKYSFETVCLGTDGKEQKMNTMDPLIAAYSLTSGHYLLTLNQHDFPESYFSVVETKVLVLSGKEAKKYRKLLYLLKPREV